MINPVDSYTYQVSPSSGSGGVSRQIGDLQTQLASLQKQLAQAEKNATTKDGALEVKILRAQITAIEARIALLKATVSNESNNNSVSAQSATNSNKKSFLSDFTGGIQGSLLDIYA